jgi:hypothetical protein
MWDDAADAWTSCHESIKNPAGTGSPNVVKVTFDTTISADERDQFYAAVDAALAGLGIAGGNSTYTATFEIIDGETVVTFTFTGASGSDHATEFADAVDDNPSLVGGYTATAVQGPSQPAGTTGSASSTKKDDDDDDDAGTIVAVVIIIVVLICGGCAVVAFLMFRKQSDAAEPPKRAAAAAQRAGARGEAAESEDAAEESGDEEEETASEDEEDSEDA